MWTWFQVDGSDLPLGSIKSSIPLGSMGYKTCLGRIKHWIAHRLASAAHFFYSATGRNTHSDCFHDLSWKSNAQRIQKVLFNAVFYPFILNACFIVSCPWFSFATSLPHPYKNEVTVVSAFLDAASNKWRIVSVSTLCASVSGHVYTLPSSFWFPTFYFKICAHLCYWLAPSLIFRPLAVSFERLMEALLEAVLWSCMIQSVERVFRRRRRGRMRCCRDFFPIQQLLARVALQGFNRNFMVLCKPQTVWALSNVATNLDRV